MSEGSNDSHSDMSIILCYTKTKLMLQNVTYILINLPKSLEKESIYHYGGQGEGQKEVMIHLPIYTLYSVINRDKSSFQVVIFLH